MKRILNNKTIIIALYCLIINQQGIRADQTPVSIAWWHIDKALVKELFNKDLLTLTNTLNAKPVSDDPADIVRRLNIYVRAGHREEASATIDHLAGIDTVFDTYPLNTIAEFLMKRRELNLARQFIELFPQTETGCTYKLIREWKATGADPQIIDDWLADRTATNPILWIRQRANIRKDLGTQDELLETLADDVKADPTNANKAHLYIEAVQTVGRLDTADWLCQIYKPKLAIDSYEIGKQFGGSAACIPLERSLATSITKEDIRRVKNNALFQLPLTLPSDQGAANYLRIWTKTVLVRSYNHLGEGQKAQKLMEEVLEASEGKKIPKPFVRTSPLARWAGEVEMASGHRTIEKKIRKQEEQNRDSPDYWLNRAEYYIGRSANELAYQALDKALQLAPVEPHHKRKGALCTRSDVLRTYYHFLARNKRIKDAAEILREELTLAPPDSHSAINAIRGLSRLQSDFKYHLNPDDPLLWTFLENRKTWDHTEKILLWKMLEEVPENRRESYWTRAEQLTRNADPTRGKEFAWIMSRIGGSRRALPILLDALDHLTEEHHRESAMYNLFEIYIDVKDYKAAEQVLPNLISHNNNPNHSFHLTTKELNERLGTLALTAAKAGAPQDALRLWRKKANIDLADLDGLEALAKSGTREQLRTFYREIMKKDPKSWVPQHVLELLK